MSNRQSHPSHNGDIKMLDPNADVGMTDIEPATAPYDHTSIRLTRETMSAQAPPATASKSEAKFRELKEWGERFKLERPIPKDILPFLAKGEGKQMEIAMKSVRLEYGP
ncbi:hypothetical protein K458DRAFT_389500 [Lentithecium fluviatile CBS 122367]|uniref:Uncharacterized protein n=1 Tax=Lentithecium fluviatile CBS 122367 TaxID=1168545 RepID=A0A6G1J068_9PLEO|nr:hypothetical protein K458DRAFT_389500 [Lentithecium fluviatile CBS 122367]